MPEAVIVAIGRYRVGRAMKGSLVDVRPDDLGAYVVRQVLDQVPELPTREIADMMCVGSGQGMAIIIERLN
jgi:acetyl-CoA C-acetyltransferase